MSSAETLVSAPKRPWRHKIILLSFLLTVVIPSVLGSLYLFLISADQYESTTAFSIKAEDMSGNLGALAAFTQITSSSVPDSAILFDYIQSRTIVDKVNADLDLLKVFNRVPSDIVFSLGKAPSAEDLVDYWQNMVRVTLDSSTSILRLDIRAFTPDDAVAISNAIIRHSTEKMNVLNSIAQEDATRYAIEDLVEVESRLKALRREIRVFRDANQLIDPSADVTSQIGVLSALQSQLATSLVERATLVPLSQGGDPRLDVIDRRIEAIRNQIASERSAIGQPTESGPALTQVIGQYEELLVDLEFAQNAYTSALASVEKARAEARRQSRYLAVHVAPDPAEESLYPNRSLFSALLVLLTFSAWSVVVLIYYNIRDRG